MSAEDKSGYKQGAMWGTHQITTSDDVDGLLKGTSQVGIMGAWIMTQDGSYNSAVKDVKIKYTASELDRSDAISVGVAASMALAITMISF